MQADYTMVSTRSQKRSFECEGVNKEVSFKKFKEYHSDDNTYQTDTDDVDDTDDVEDTNDVDDTDDVDDEFTENETLGEMLQNTVRSLVTKFQDKNKKEHKHRSEDEYENFQDFLDNIQNGNFFERVPIEESETKLKNKYTKEQILEFNKQLSELEKSYKDRAPSVIDILKMDVPISQKQKLLEKLYHYSNSDMLTNEYNANLKHLMSSIDKTHDADLFKLEQEILATARSDDHPDDYKYKILKSEMSFQNKVIAYKRLEVMERYEDSDSSEYAKYKNWMDLLLTVPFGKLHTNPTLEDGMSTVKEYIHRVREVLDKQLSFMEKPKDQIINVVSQMVRNPDTCINAIGLHGCPGVGKTQIASSISNALGRPLRVVSLGGESDSSMMLGHNFTYVGSSPGRLIDILNETKCMNPVILFDELDKLSQTTHGKEIIGALIHLTDSSSNKKYNYDRYFSGVEFDLSKVLFIFTYNDPTKIDKILADRLFKIKVDNYSVKEKLEITTKHLVPNVLHQYTFKECDIQFSQDAISHIINESKNDEGMRGIKRKFEIIVSRVNTLLITDEAENIVKLKYKVLYPHYKSLPVKIQKEHVDVFLSESVSNSEADSSPPFHMYI